MGKGSANACFCVYVPVQVGTLGLAISPSAVETK